MDKKAGKEIGSRRVVIWLVALSAIAALVAVVTLTWPQPEVGTVAVGRAGSGEAAPLVEMVDFVGVPLSLSEYAGTPVILNFWASWCPFCIAEMPDFERVDKDAGERVAFIGVNLQDDPTAAARLAEETGITYRLTRDPHGVVYQAFGGIGMPTTVFIDAEGLVREVITGQMSEAQLRSKIAEHFSIDV